MGSDPGSRRALRRHHAARKKRWVRRALPHFFLDPAVPEPRRIGLYAATPKVCSCFMCGNPRRYFGESPIRERRSRGAGDEPEWSPEAHRGWS